MKKTFKLFLALALVVVPFFAAMPVVADSGTGSVGTPAVPAEAAVTKFLQMPCGTARPDATFTFEMTFAERLTGPAPATFAPAMVTETVSMANAVALTDAQRTANGFADDVCVYAITTPDLLSDITWTHPGQFLFTVREVVNTNAGTQFLPGYVEDMFYDATEFTLLVRVGVASNGDLYVQYTASWNERPSFDLNGEPVECDLPGVDYCLDYTDGKGNPDPNDPGNIDGFTDLRFINTFIRRTEDDGNTPGGTPGAPGEGPDLPGGDLPGDIPSTPGDPSTPGTPGEPPVVPNLPHNNAFMITKNIDGQLANPTSTFDFSAQVNLPSLVPNAPIFGWIYTYEAGSFVQGERVDFVSGQTNTFQLGHNQAFIFAPLPIGSRVVATELANDGGYTPRVYLTLGGADQAGVNPRSGTAAAGVTTYTENTDHRLGEGVNHARFINAIIDVPITGLLLNNLPLILVVTGATGFFVMMVINKKRRAYE